MPKRKAPKGTFWRGPVLWGRVEIRGKDVWSLHTDDPAVAKARRKLEKDRAVAAAYYGEGRRAFASVLEAWEPHITRQVAPNTAARYAVSMGQLQPFLDGLYLDEVTGALIAEIIHKRQSQSVSNATIRRDLVALSSVMGYAIDQGWREDNPVLARLGRLKERRDPIVLPDANDIHRVIARAPTMFSKLIDAAWMTGCRLDELVYATHSRLDHRNKQLTIIGKGNKLRVIDLTDWGFERIFARLPVKLGKPWLFWHHGGEPYKTASGRFKTLVKSCVRSAQKQEQHFRPFRFHDLRHRHAVDWLKSGRSIYDLQQHLGHSSVKTTEIYLTYLTGQEQRTVKYGPEQKPEQEQWFRNGESGDK
jgi:integrase/recombinase XerD